ncbi:hypothetical protein, partial [Salmonella sp. SAL4358]
SSTAVAKQIKSTVADFLKNKVM